MAQEIISQFRRVFNSPIEIYRQVATPTERDNIPSGVRWTGMLVYVVSDGVTYSLSGGGLDNGSWELLGGLQDAPSDGQTYGRKDGNWELIVASEKLQFKFPPSGVTGIGYNTVFSDTIGAGNFPNDNDSFEIFATFKGGPGLISADVTLRYSFGSASIEVSDFSGSSGSVSFVLRGFVQRISSTEINMSITGWISGKVVYISNAEGATVPANGENVFLLSARDVGGSDALKLTGGYARKI